MIKANSKKAVLSLRLKLLSFNFVDVHSLLHTNLFLEEHKAEKLPKFKNNLIAKGKNSVFL